MTFELPLPDVIVKPYVRMTRRGKYVSLEAQEYLASKAELSYQIKQAMLAQGREMFPGQTPLSVVIALYAPSKPGHRCDLDNQVKAILDACNGIVFPDDRWVDWISAHRVIGMKPFLRLTVFEALPLGVKH